MTKKNTLSAVHHIGCLIELIFIGAVCYAYTLGLWIGIFATALWVSGFVFFSVPWSVVILELFLPVGRVQKAWAGNDILEPKPSEKPISPDPALEGLIGKTAKAYTDLKPEGTILSGTERLPAKSTMEFIARDSEVRIVGVKGKMLLVEPRTD